MTVHFRDKHATDASYGQDDNLDQSSWLFALVRRNPQVLTLDLTNCRMAVHIWAELFRMAIALLRLRVASCDLSLGLVTALKPGIPPAMVCPRLQYLVIDNDLDLLSSSLRVIVQMRKKSRTGVSPICWIVVRGVARENMGPKDVRWLKRSVEGLLIECFDIRATAIGGYDGDSDWEVTENEIDVSEGSDNDSDTEFLASGDLDVLKGIGKASSLAHSLFSTNRFALSSQPGFLLGPRYVIKRSAIPDRVVTTLAG